MLRKVILHIVLAAVWLCLTACGKNESGPELGIDGYIYVAEKLPAEEDFASLDNVKVFGEYVYFQKNGKIYRTSLDELELTDEKEEIRCLDHVEDYIVDEAQNIYYFKRSSGSSASMEEIMQTGIKGTLFRQASGAEKEEVLLDGIFIPGNAAGRCLALLSEGEVFLLTEDAICLADGMGDKGVRLSTEDYKPKDGGWEREALVQGADNRIYYCVQNGGYLSVYEIVREPSWRILETDWGQRLTGEGIYGAAGGLLLDDGNSLRQYRPGETSPVEIVRWQESALQNIDGVVWLDENRLLCSMLDTSTLTAEIYLLTKTSADEFIDREILVMAAVSPSSSLLNIVARFNRSSERYYVILKDYGEEAGVDAAIVSKNPPDLLNMTGLNVAKYARKEVLADLTPFLESSLVLSREDFLENVLEGYTLEGKLVCIPDSFYLSAVFARPSQAGRRTAGWRIEDCYELTEKYPGSRLFEWDDWDYILGDFCADHILESFVDREGGSCRFDSEDFRGLLKWVNENSGRDTGERSEILPDDVLMMRRDFTDLAYYDYYEKVFGGEIVMIGNPTLDGRPMHHVRPMSEIGILEESENKEGAWEFLEYLLGDREPDKTGGFPARRDKLERMIEEEETLSYQTNEKGEMRLDSEGEPIPVTKRTYYLNGEGIDFHALTKEQADAIRAAFGEAVFAPRDLVSQEILNVILEEAAAARNGDRSLEEVSAVIQKRAELILNEEK